VIDLKKPAGSILFDGRSGRNDPRVLTVLISELLQERPITRGVHMVGRVVGFDVLTRPDEVEIQGVADVFGAFVGLQDLTVVEPLTYRCLPHSFGWRPIERNDTTRVFDVGGPKDMDFPGFAIIYTGTNVR
jgi:hypothetical protein